MNTLRVPNLAAAVAVFAAVLAVGCSSTSTDQKPAPVSDAAPMATSAPPPAPPPAKAYEAPPPAPLDPLDDPKSILAKRSVYFEFDRSSMSDSDVAVVEAHGRYLIDHPARSVRIEGNCDERGGREYNLALGQRRADAVKERLKLLGVSTSKIETISLGKEKPRNLGHTEAAWAENRRADIVYK